jgi:hypothetical protein
MEDEAKKVENQLTLRNDAAAAARSLVAVLEALS